MQTMIYIMNYIDGLVHDCSNSSANALELPQSCTKPLIWYNILYILLFHCPFDNSIPRAGDNTWGFKNKNNKSYVYIYKYHTSNFWLLLNVMYRIIYKDTKYHFKEHH